jgi:YfiH family protein
MICGYHPVNGGIKMGLIHCRGLNCFQFPALANLPDFIHGVFLGKGVNGRRQMMPFNLGLGHGTPDEMVWRNRERMQAFFGPEYFGVYAHQVHGIDVGIYSPSDDANAHHADQGVHLNGDALITHVPGAVLVIQVADCQPVIIVDPATGVIANIHSGWRGSLQNIIGVTIDRMQAQYKSRPQDLVCAIGPSLGPCCAEFVNYKQEIPQTFWGYRRPNDFFDFWQISIDQLINAGVKPVNISLAGICTKCNQHLFFSYRGDQLTGRFAAVVGIRFDKGRGI